jgi:uncharacterized membrane protein YoaK (UPF0700 family)
MATSFSGAPRDASATVDRHGPLPGLLFVLTAVTGLVDAVSYLQLGHVFVANMTGNVVFLGLAAAGAAGFSAAASLIAIGAFLAGALVGGRLGSQFGRHRGRYVAYATYVQLTLVGAALAVSVATASVSTNTTSYALITLLALAMGLQNAAAHRLGVPGRLAAIGTMCLGAAVGGFLALRSGTAAVLALVTLLLVWNAIRAYRLSRSSELWAVGT